MDMTSILGLAILIGWLGVCVWSWSSPSTKAPPSTPQEDRDRAIGFIIGALGGTVEAAAEVRYAISRLEEDLGRPATAHEIATAVGVTLGSGA